MVDVVVIEHPYEKWHDCYTVVPTTAAGERIAATCCVGERKRIGLREYLTLQAIAALDGLEVRQVTAH